MRDGWGREGDLLTELHSWERGEMREREEGEEGTLCGHCRSIPPLVGSSLHPTKHS